MNECRRCAEEVDASSLLPLVRRSLRIKVTELFGGADGKALRVSATSATRTRSPRSA